MTMENHATPPQAPPPGTGAPWLKALLALSLGANLLIAGIFIGSSLNPAGPGPGPGPGPAPGAGPRPPQASTTARLLRELGLAPFIAAFPADVRRQMGRDLRARLGPPQADRAELLDELEQILALLRGAPFDATALSAVFERQSQRLDRRTEIGRQVLVEAIANLTPAQRAALADRFESSLRRAREGAPVRPAPGGAPPARP